MTSLLPLFSQLAEARVSPIGLVCAITANSLNYTVAGVNLAASLSCSLIVTNWDPFTLAAIARDPLANPVDVVYNLMSNATPTSLDVASTHSHILSALTSQSTFSLPPQIFHVLSSNCTFAQGEVFYDCAGVEAFSK